jgi:hypothetical protein
MLLVSCAAHPIDPQEDKQASCDLLLSRHRPAVAALFEIEMRQRGYSDWDRALADLGVSSLDSQGNVGDPQVVADTVLQRLIGISVAIWSTSCSAAPCHLMPGAPLNNTALQGNSLEYLQRETTDLLKKKR